MAFGKPCVQRVCEGLIVYARPLFSGVCGLLLSVYLCGTFRTVFGASGTGQKEGSADLAASCSFGTEDLVLQFRLQRKNTTPEVLADQGTISPYLQSAIARNWHSLSDLNEYAELVLSGCFDTFVFRDKLTVTFRVRRKEEINVLDLANFVLPAAQLLSDGKPESVRVKTTLHSPGDIILQIWNFTQDNALPLLMCYLAVFGGKAGDYEFNSLVGIIKDVINHKYNKEKKELELKKLAADVDNAEQDALGKKLDNIEKLRNLRISTVDECTATLAEASQNLEVEPSAATIIDITEVLKSHKEDQPS